MWVYRVFCYFFFFKQKTAYEMRISDWSSDVCSSDLTSSARTRSEMRSAGCAGVSRTLAEPPWTPESGWWRVASLAPGSTMGAAPFLFEEHGVSHFYGNRPVLHRNYKRPAAPRAPAGAHAQGNPAATVYHPRRREHGAEKGSQIRMG